jgi:tetratricopeptide (TPR) repeat protein
MEIQDTNWESIIGDKNWDTYCQFTSEERHNKITELERLLENGSHDTQKAEILLQVGRLWSAEGWCVDNVEAQQNAVANFRNAIALQPDFPRAWNSLGGSFTILKEDEDSIDAFGKAVQLKPDYYVAWVNLGRAFYHTGQYEEAVASYDKALNLNPDDHETWSNRGGALLNLGRHKEAVISYARVLKLRPEDLQTLYYHGSTLINLCRYEEAIVSYEQLFKLKPDDCQAWYFHGFSLNRLGRYEEAIASFSEALQREPNDFQIWNEHGFALKNLGRDEEAIASYDKALQHKPNDSYAWHCRGIALATLGRYEEAVISYDNALRHKLDDPQIWSNRGSALINLCRYEDAIANYERLSQLKPDDFYAWYYLGFSFHNLSKCEEAIASFDEALTLKSDDAQTWNDRGMALLDLEKYKEALESFDRALLSQPKLASAWAYRGLILIQLKRYDEGIASYDQALQHEPNHPFAWHSKITVLFDLERYNEVMASCDQVLDCKPEDASAWISWIYRGEALAELEKYEEAIDSYNEASKYESNYPSVWYYRGNALVGLGDCAGAISDYDRYLEFQPQTQLQFLYTQCTTHSVWCARGNALAKLGRYEEAISNYDKALSLRPDFHDAWIGRGFTALISAMSSVNHGWSNFTQMAQSLPPELQHPDLDLRGYEGCRACTQEGFRHTPEDSEAWGRLHQSLGEACRLWSIYQDNPYPYLHKAIDYYEQALNIFMATTFPQERLEVLTLLIRLYRALQTNDGIVLALLNEGTALLHRLLAEAVSETQKQRLGLRFASFGQATVDLLVQQGEVVKALEAAESDKNSLMTWLLRWQDPETIPTASYEDMRQLLQPHTAIVYWHFSPDVLTTFILRWDRAQPTVINRAIDDSQAGVRQVNQLESWLKDWNQTYTQYIGKDKANPNHDETWRENLPSVLLGLADLLDIAQINNNLEGITQLILVPHRDLHRLPLAAIFPDNYPRIVTVLPSLQLGLALNPTLPLKLQTITGLSIEAPRHQDYPFLPHAYAESLLLHHQMPQLTTISGKQATLAVVKKAMAEPYAVIHFNGHASYNAAQPTKSALALKGDDLLTVGEIYGLEPPLQTCQLVSLASCETAITGSQTITTEYVGIVSAFLSHRIPYVLSTLWTIESSASAMFILQFYQRLHQGVSIPQAFQQSQTWFRTVTVETLIHNYETLLQNLSDNCDRQLHAFLETEIKVLGTMEPDRCPYAHPYYWAAFILTGKFGNYE